MIRISLAFFLYFLSIGLSFGAPPIPLQKPQTNNFDTVIEASIMRGRVPSPPPAEDLIQATTISGGMILPPPLPEQKQEDTIITTLVINGVPVPSSKPYKVRILSAGESRNTLPDTVTDKTVTITYGGEGAKERMAMRLEPKPQAQGRMERIYAQPRINLRETNDGSPFQTAALPRAGESSSRDPVIIYFKEYSHELEVGQIDVINSDIARVLERSPRLRVTIYGYAENDARNRDKAQELSLKRAMMIAEFLSDRGIDRSRIEARAMGGDTPIDPKSRVDVIIF
jgi:outer membrane protein OmpA-like peptidoglycan-associated protein